MDMKINYEQLVPQVRVKWRAFVKVDEPLGSIRNKEFINQLKI
jgi:hypothetical protein